MYTFLSSPHAKIKTRHYHLLLGLKHFSSPLTILNSTSLYSSLDHSLKCQIYLHKISFLS